MFGRLLTPTPTPSTPTPPIPTLTPGVPCTGADMAVSRQNNTVQDTQLEVLLEWLEPNHTIAWNDISCITSYTSTLPTRPQNKHASG